MELDIVNYPHILGTLKEKIKQAKLRAALSVNAELLGIYWEIGHAISVQEAEAGWGARIVDRLADDLRAEFPDMKGFSTRNLRYMREFYQAYPFPILQPVVAKLEIGQHEDEQKSEGSINQDDTILQSLVAKLPWTHHVVILTKAREPQERSFYILKCIENGWSRSQLEIQIDTKLHLRQGSSLNNFSETLPQLQSDLAQATFKNPYIFDFLSLGQKMKERDMEQGLIQHLKKFLLELGKGFAYIGNQYRLRMDGDDFFLDLLFYNIPLRAYILFDLKLEEFRPEFAGKLNFYVNAVDGELRGPDDKPTIGVLLCKTPNSTVVKYSLRGINNPIGISDYQLAEVLPSQLTSEMPSIEELEAEVDKEYQELKKPIDSKLNKVKEMMQNLQLQEAKEIRSPEIVRHIFESALLPIRDEILKSLAEITSQFRDASTLLLLGSQALETGNEARDYFAKNEESDEFRLEVHLRGCIPAGSNAFDVFQCLTIRMENYHYLIGLGHPIAGNSLLEGTYNELPGSQARQGIVEAFTEAILDDLEARLSVIIEKGKNDN